MPVNTAPPCCCREPKDENFCYGCYPNSKVSPITVQIERKPRYPPYPKANVKPINFDDLFPEGPGSTAPVSSSQVPCPTCAKILREKEIQLVRKQQELFQLQKHLRKQGGPKHDYGSLRAIEFYLRKRDQELAVLNMEEQRLAARRIMTKIERPTCIACTQRLRQRELALRKIEQEVVLQMASPYIKISPNPCDCCSPEAPSIAKVNEKKRKKNQKNCFKELNKREKELKQKERAIDKKVKQFRKDNLEEAKENLKKTPDDLIKEVFLNCKCACTRTTDRKKNFDACSFLPNAKSGSWACTMPFPMWNGSVSPQLHDCSTKCCVMKLLESIASCYFNPGPCLKKKKKVKTDETCAVMRILRWWAFRNKL